METERIQPSTRTVPSLSTRDRAIGGMRGLAVACIRTESSDLAGSPGARSLAPAIPRSLAVGAALHTPVSANVAPKPVDLLQYGLMASVYAREVLGKPEPTVGLLNVGTEEEKGTELVQEAAKLLRDAPGVRFAGFVEGHDVFGGTTDVVVCDGFTGNVVLKCAEGQAGVVVETVKRVLGKVFRTDLEKHRVRLALHELKAQLDWAEYGGGVPVAVRAGVNSALLVLREAKPDMFERVKGLLERS